MISPCLKLCRLDSARQACLDCGRTLVEIGLWASLTDAERAAIMADLPARRARRAEQASDVRPSARSQQGAQQQQ